MPLTSTWPLDFTLNWCNEMKIYLKNFVKGQTRFELVCKCLFLCCSTSSGYRESGRGSLFFQALVLILQIASWKQPSVTPWRTAAWSPSCCPTLKHFYLQTGLCTNAFISSEHTHTGSFPVKPQLTGPVWSQCNSWTFCLHFVFLLEQHVEPVWELNSLFSSSLVV